MESAGMKEGPPAAGPETREGGEDFNLRLLESIRLLQTRFIANHDLRTIFDQFILEILRLTESEYAFVGEILHGEDGHPYLKVHDISHIARDEATRAFFESHAPAGAEFHNLNNLFGRAILDRRPVIANTPHQDPRRGGRQPAGHPPMHSFLGLPLLIEEEAVGLVGLANRAQGYDDALVNALQPVLSSCAAIIDSHRNYRRRVQAEEDLSRSGRLFRALVEKSAEATAVLSRDGRMLYASPSSLAILGYTPEEMMTLPRFGLVHPDDEAAAQERFGRIMSGRAREASGEMRVRRKSGEYIWVDIHLTDHLEDPAIGGIVSIYRDITERKRSQRALLQAEESLHLAVEAAGLGTWYCDLPLDRIQMNARCREQFGWSPAEDIDFEKFYAKLHPDDREPTRGIVAEAVAEKRAYDTYYRVIPEVGADPRWIRAMGKVIHDAQGHPSRFYGVCIDVTDLRRHEELMRQSQKMEAIGRLAGGIAHDFNNLLTAINGYSELCLGQLSPGHPLSGPLEEIHRSGERAASLTQQLLAYSRKQMLMPRLMDLNAMVRESERLVARLIGEDIRVRLSLGEDAGRVRVDPVQLQQAIMNLAINSRDAMPSGGELVLATSSIRLAEAVGDLPPGPYARLEVADTGTGIPPDVLPKIFEPFFTTKPVGKGTGLGLSMVYGMVRQSGGQITVASEEGSGTRFTVLLPSAEGEREPVTDAGIPAPVRGASGRGRTLLLVEDEPAVLTYLGHILRVEGYAVHAYADPREALDWIRGRGAPPDLLLTDVVMEGMSGATLAERARELHPGLPVVFMSGYTDNEMLKYGIRENQVPFLQKPVARATLVETLRSVLDGRPKPPPA